MGLAVSDETQTFVFGRDVIRGFKSLDNLFAKIEVLCREEKVVGIVFGLPEGKDGEVTERYARFEEIGKRLEVYLKDIPVFFQDESYSSFEADTSIDDPKLREKYNSHELAAMIILERYLKRLA